MFAMKTFFNGVRVRAREDRSRRREAFWKKQISEPVTVLFPDEMHDLLDPEIV